MTEYTVRYLRHGIHVVGAVPIDAFLLLTEHAVDRGHTESYPGIAQSLGGGFVFASPEAANLWIAEIESKNEKKYDDPLLRWFSGADTGISSTTIAHVLGGTPLRTRADVPYDPADFGRCVRLLDQMDAACRDRRETPWRDRLWEVAECYPAWSQLVSVWAELEAMYESADEDSGRALYDRIRALTVKQVELHIS